MNPFQLLITGSRIATPAMLTMAIKAVYRAKELGWQILVGDNPTGVDAAVIDTCSRIGVKPIIYGISKQPRKTPKGDFEYRRIRHHSYMVRDQHMINDCDRVLAIWNGQSRGTKAGFEYAHSIKKLADLKRFS